MYYLDETGKRVYTLKVRRLQDGGTGREGQRSAATMRYTKRGLKYILSHSSYLSLYHLLLWFAKRNPYPGCPQCTHNMLTSNPTTVGVVTTEGSTGWKNNAECTSSTIFT